MNVILKGLVGSRLYGFATDDSDYDYRGIYVAPTEEWLSLQKPKDTLRPQGDDDVVYYEVEKFIRLCLAANPTILELLYLPKYEIIKTQGAILVAARKAFLSTRVRQTYGGYVHQQVRKLVAHEGDYFESKVRNRYEKHARHICRLLHQGVQLVETGELDPVVPEELREELLTIGQRGVDYIQRYVVKNLERMDKGTTCLPDKPDYELANNILLEIRRRN